MACRQIWEDVYALEVHKANVPLATVIAGTANFGIGTHGVRGGFGTGSGLLTPKYNMLVDGSYPPLKAAYQTVEKNLATGKSLPNVISLTPVAAKPEPVVIPMVWNAHNLSAMFRLFSQDGMTLSTGTANTALQIMTCVPYISACPIVYGNLVRFRQAQTDSDTVDQVLKGVIPTRIMIKGEEGGVIEGEVEFLGAKWDHVDLSEKLNAAIGYDDTPPLKFEDLTVKLGTSVISIPSFEITFSNGLVHHYYNDISSKSTTLGRMNVEAQITVPWNDGSVEGSDQQITDYAAGVTKVVSLIWGNPSPVIPQGAGSGEPAPTLYGGVDTLAASAKNNLSNNYLAIHGTMRIMDYDENDIDENPMVQTNFKTVVDGYNTLNGIRVYLGYLSTANNWTETT